MLLSILSSEIKNYFIYNVNQKLTFAKMYNWIKTKFNTKVNKAQYQINWTLIIYSLLKAKKNKIRKINLEVLQVLLGKLQL